MHDKVLSLVIRKRNHCLLLKIVMIFIKLFNVRFTLEVILPTGMDG